MKPRIERRPQARRDVLESAAYLALEAGEEVALRFAAAVEKTLRNLADQPGIGSSRWPWVLPQLAGLRSRPVPGFESWLVFYFALEDGIEVMRVLHGARDLETTLGSEQGR